VIGLIVVAASWVAGAVSRWLAVAVLLFGAAALESVIHRNRRYPAGVYIDSMPPITIAP